MERFGAPGLRPDWSIQTKESEDFINSAGVLSKGHMREGPGKLGRLTHKGFRGSHTRNLYLHVTLWALIQGMLLGRD